jgi:hypothetical protein
MKTNTILLLLTILSLALITSCKKDNGTNSDTPQGNYFKLNSDTRNLAAIPSTKITVNNGAWTNPDQWQLSLGIKSDCYKIAGLNNDEFDIFINIWDKNLTKTEYELVPGYSAGGSSAGPFGKASIGMRPYKIGGSGLTFFDAQSGKITITKDASGKLKSVEFSNLPLNQYSGASYTTSGRFSVN